MTRRSIAWALGAVLALTLPVWAQGADDEQTNCTVKSEDVKSWKMDVEGKEYSVRAAAPAYEGDTGLFHMSSAYTLPKGKVSFSIFRDNYDRDPKDIDFSVHGFSLGYGATGHLELFGSLGFQNRVNADAYTQAGFFNDLPFAGTTQSYPSWQTGRREIQTARRLRQRSRGSRDPWSGQSADRRRAKRAGHGEGLPGGQPDPLEASGQRGRSTRLDRLRQELRS
jgi:hypothetical protein